MVFSSSEIDEALLEVHSQVDIVETSVSMAKPHSEEARVQALGEDRSVAGSEREEIQAQYLKWLKKLIALLYRQLQK
ncbi:protein of unknown function [Streptococcus thermophilus]|nr:protein of unknown function [Streptococcus thermophilus]